MNSPELTRQLAERLTADQNVVRSIALLTIAGFKDQLILRAFKDLLRQSQTTTLAIADRLIDEHDILLILMQETLLRAIIHQIEHEFEKTVSKTKPQPADTDHPAEFEAHLKKVIATTLTFKYPEDLLFERFVKPFVRDHGHYYSKNALQNMLHAKLIFEKMLHYQKSKS